MNTNEPRSILITGCSSGIGLCVADGLKQRGYRVFATARNQDDVRTLENQGHEALQLDLDDSDSIRQAVGEILSRTNNQLYALFNNGAYGQPGAVEDLGRDTLRAQFETNLFGWHELTNMLLPVMRQQGYGRIIQNSSVLGFVALKYRGAYNASKYALEGLTDTLRLEFKGTDIHFCLVEPGPIESHFRANALKAFYANIDVENSPHRQVYGDLVKKLQTEGPVVPFTLKADAVLDKVIHALEAKTPKARYYVTFPTYLFGYLKRLLPIRVMDRILEKV
jgi:NAD(P)-dependent dehydrogenase (short-subunit alcohol dehydrogenase family)